MNKATEIPSCQNCKYTLCLVYSIYLLFKLSPFPHISQNEGTKGVLLSPLFNLANVGLTFFYCCVSLYQVPTILVYVQIQNGAHFRLLVR